MRFEYKFVNKYSFYVQYGYVVQDVGKRKE